MKLKQLLEQLNQLAKEKPEALEMEVLVNICVEDKYADRKMHKLESAMIGHVIKKPQWYGPWDDFKAFMGEDRESNNKNTTGAIILQPSETDLKPLKGLKNFKPYN
jgi:hypothetical protein